MTEVAATADAHEGEARRGLARHPWLWFFLIALVPTVVVALPGDLTAVSEINTDGFALLAALLVAWSCGRSAAPLPAARGRRIAVFTAAFAALLAISLWYHGPSGVELSLLTVVVTATALAAAYARTSALRELVRPLLTARASWPAWLVAALALPLLGALVIGLSHLGAAAPAGGAQPISEPSLIPGSLAAALPAAIAWYGFAVRRLLRQRSPLVTALLVGLVPWLAIVLPLSLWSSPLHQLTIVVSDPLGSFPLRTCLSAFALGVAGVWTYQRSRGSLLPVLVLLWEATLVSWAVFVWSGPNWALSDDLYWLLAGLYCAGALVLIIEGRMWRREGDDA